MIDDFALLGEVLLQIALIGGIIFLANLALKRQNLTILVKVGLMFINLGILLLALVSAVANNAAIENSVMGAAILLATTLAATALLFDQTRVGIAGLFPKQRINPVFASEAAQPTPAIDFLARYAVLSDGETLYLDWPNPLSNTIASAIPTADTNTNNQREILGFDPHNIVHALALIIAIYAIGVQIGLFVLAGGLSALAEDIEISGITLLANFLPMVILPLLGVGIFMRRSLPDVFKRLGLTTPTLEDIVVGVGVGIVLFFIQIVFTGIWLTVVGMDTFTEQTEASEALSNSITSIWIALGIAITAGIGEEIAFRGALQPIFGLWWTAILFTVVHLQYTLTPAALLIFFIAIVLGYMRRYFSLYACITTHFVYNLILVLLALAFQS